MNENDGSGRAYQSKGLYGGVPYEAPEVPSHYHGDDEREPLPTRDKVLRITLSAILAAVGLFTVVRAVLAAVALPALQAEPQAEGVVQAAWVGLFGTILLSALLLAYPVVNLVRLRRARR